MRTLTVLFLSLCLTAGLTRTSSAQQVHIGVGGGSKLSHALPVLGGKKAPTGELIGEAEFGGRRVKAMLHKAGGGWVLALQTGAKRLADLVPAVRGTIADGFGLSAPVLAIADSRARVKLSPAARAFYGVDTLDVERGVNLISVATPEGDVKATLRAAGVNLPRVVLIGVMLRDFDSDAISQAKKDGKLAKALRKGTMLKAIIPNFSARLPKGVSTGDAYVYVTGEPGVGIGFAMTMNRKLFEARLGMRRTDLGATEASIFATSKGRWHDAFGIKGFHLDEVSMVMSLDAAQRFGIGLKAKMAIGSRTMSVGGKVLLHAVTGAPLGGAFEGSISKLTSNDLLWLLDARSRRGKVKRGELPAFELRDAYLRIAPGGGDSDLGIKSGFGIKGKLIAFGKTIAAVEGEMDESPMLQLKGHIRSFDLGAVSLKDAKVDVRMGAVKDPYFMMRGAARVLSASKSLNIQVSRDRYFFATSEKVGGVYEADSAYSARAGVRPAWSLDARFKNHFSRTLEQDVSRRALAWANQVKGDFGRAQAGLDKARRDVASLDNQIRAMRGRVYGERKRKWDEIEKIRARINWLSGQIAARESKLNGHRKYVAKLKSIRDREHGEWKAAVKKTKKAKVWDKPKYKAIEAGKWTDYTTAKASYDIANKNLVKLARALDPQLNARRAERNAATASYNTQSAVYRQITRISVDADPRVAGLIAAKRTADASLYAAKKVVGATGATLQAAGRMTAWAARNHGKILMVDAASFRGSLDSYVRGSAMDMRLQLRVMGKARHVRLAASARDITSGRLFENLWKILKG